MKKYEFLPHTSEIKFNAFGRTLNEALENSVIAISKILSRGGRITTKEKRVSLIKGDDYEKILYNLIDEILYFLDSEGFVVSKAKVSLDKKNKALKVLFYGDNAKNYKNLDYIKSATYSDMKIIKNKKKKIWMIQAVVDV
ncbi:MAG: archease [Candidatus Pacearchaeota archaeon]